MYKMIESTSLKIKMMTSKRIAYEQQASFELLVNSCWDDLWRYAFRITGNRDNAEDLLSDALIKGFQSYHQFRGDTPFVRWMLKIVTHTHIDNYRRAVKRPVLSLDGMIRNGGGDNPSFDIPDEMSNPEKLALDSCLSDSLEWALNQLPVGYRLAVILADIEQFDYVEVAKILSIPVGTVRSRVHRGRGQLRELLDTVKKMELQGNRWSND